MKYVKLNNNRIYDVRHLKIDGPLKDGLSTELFVAYSGKHYGTLMNGVISLNHLCDVNDIVKESDDIEELCDFVDIQYEDGTWETYFYENEFKIKSLFKKAKQVLYGIRTNEGLIYAAEMNRQGDLELL